MNPGAIFLLLSLAGAAYILTKGSNSGGGALIITSAQGQKILGFTIISLHGHGFLTGVPLTVIFDNADQLSIGGIYPTSESALAINIPSSAFIMALGTHTVKIRTITSLESNTITFQVI